MKEKVKTRSAPEMISNQSRAITPSKGTPPPGFAVRRILVPLDLSEPSKNALRYAFALAQQFGAKLILLYAIEPVATPDFAYHPLTKETGKVRIAAAEGLKKLCAEERIDPSWIEQTLIREGVAHGEITDGAKSSKADLIVIATHGYTGLKHVLLGSTTERVVRHAGCPVLVVRGYA